MPLSSSAKNKKQNIPLPGQKVVHCDAEELSAEKKKTNPPDIKLLVLEVKVMDCSFISIPKQGTVRWSGLC